MDELIAKQERTSGHIIRAYDNLKRLGTANITQGVVEAKVAVLDTKWKAFSEAHDVIEATATAVDRERAYFTKEVYQLTEDGYFINKGKFLDMIRSAPGGERTTRPVTAAAQQLPKISLPKFSGDFSEWPAFRDLFTSMVGDNTALTPIEKLHYLKMSLAKEPAALLASTPLTADNLQPAWKILTERYENIRLLTSAQIAIICSLPPMKSESSSELKALFNGTVNAVSALRALGRPVDGYDDFLVYVTTQKLDKQSRREWESSMSSQKKPPSFSALQTFLSARICAVQALEPQGLTNTSSAKASGPPAGQSRNESKSGNKVRVHQASSAAAGAKACVFCQQEHYIASCESFRAKPVDERKAFVLASNLCMNCLGRHYVRECRSQKLCQTCKAKHHTLIHGATSNIPKSTSSATGRTESSASLASEHLSASSNADVTSHNARCNPLSSTGRVLLATALVNAFSAGGTPILARALLDQGSEASFVSESLAQRLRLPRSSASVNITGIGGRATLRSRGRVALKISSRIDSRCEVEFGALVLPRLTSYAPPRSVVATTWPHLDGLTLADPDVSSNVRVDLLLGADVFSQLLLPGVKKGSPDAPVAQNTRLGWVLSGRVSQHDEVSLACTCHQLSVEYSLSSSLQRFWEQEEMPSLSPLTADEEKCEEHFASTHTRTSEGRYVVRLPLKTSLETLGDSFTAASRMLHRMEQRFSRDEVFAKGYSSFLAEYEELGHMESVPAGVAEPALVYYLPHHGVIRESSETTKLRVVFNGSQKTSLGFSLNECLHVGPTLLPELIDVILRWRMHAVVFSADMEKMFRQILVHPDDRDLQRILWRRSSGSRAEPYRLCTVTYGLACAPFLALRVVRQLALDEQQRFPRGSEALLTDVYVDDVLSGANDVASALSKQREIVELLKAGGFSLRKWTSNSLDVLSHLSSSDRATGTSFTFPSEPSFHMLGLSWRAEGDCFVFRHKIHHLEPPLTKRKVLSLTAELFDPLGWLSPVIIRAKIFLQSLWLLKLDWDDPLPVAEAQEWDVFYEHLSRISDVSIPRWLNLRASPRDIELHGFADASERAYAAVVYLTVGNPCTSTLVAAKTKVAPVKQVSLPRLELCAAQLLAKLVERVLKILHLTCTVHLWSDSTVTLAWIKAHPTRWKTYVANRVSEIQRALPDAVWRHVESKQNPADCASRGLLASELREHELWWKGPSWLTIPREGWPIRSIDESVDPPEQRVISHVATREYENPCELLTRYSSLDRLERIVAWCRRFAANSRRHGDQHRHERQLSHTLLASEISASLSCLVKLEQSRIFSCEVAAASSRVPIAKGPLLRLNPFLDGEGQLRVGGRLKHSLLDSDERHPVIIPRESPLALLLVERSHRRTLHGGTQLTLATLRQRFWVISARSLVKTFIGRCIRCLRFRAATATQLMGDLPRERVTRSLPFFHTGVDYAGPIYLRTTKGRGHKAMKAYIAVFVCFSTRAVHLEAVSDYSTDAFLAAYKRFTSRRGLCRTISSDCGTNFVGADSELRSLFTVASSGSKEIANALAADGVEWKFNPPSAPHFGGLWEAAVKSVKHHLRRVIGDTTLTFEEMATLLAQIEACLNSRPLSALTDDVEDLGALTPGHFLIGAPLSAVPEPTLVELPASRLSRWQLIQQMRDSFWGRWSSEYLHQLQARSKWHKPQPSLQVGDLVLVVSEISPPTKWPLARVVATHPGGDGHVRVASVKTSTATLKRPVAKLCLLAKRDVLEKNEV